MTDTASLTAATNLLHSLTSAATAPEPANQLAWLTLAYDQLQHWLTTGWPAPAGDLPASDRNLIEALTAAITEHETTPLLLLNTCFMVLRALHEPAGTAASIVHVYSAGVRIITALARLRDSEAPA